MQLIVLGMHRSGTSALVRLLGLMGCHIGGEGSFHAADAANPKGYWEHKQVWGLDEELLRALDSSWFDVTGVDLERLDPERRLMFEERARRVVRELAPHRPWAIKDPRLCLLFPLWRAVLDRPICLLVHRNPLEVARSLATRDDFPLAFGIALWERYVVDSLAHTAGLERLIVSHRQLVSDPHGTLLRLADELSGLGVTGLSVPNDNEIGAFVDPGLHRARSEPDEEAGYLGSAQASLLASIEDGSVLGRETAPELSAGSAELLRWYPRFAATMQELSEQLHTERHEHQKAVQEKLRERREHQKVLQELREQLEQQARHQQAVREGLQEELRHTELARDHLARERANIIERIGSLETDLRRAMGDAETSIGFGLQMEELIRLILESGRWKLADWTGETLRRARLQERQPRAGEHAERILGDFRRWRESRSDTGAGDE